MAQRMCFERASLTTSRPSSVHMVRSQRVPYRLMLHTHPCQGMLAEAQLRHPLVVAISWLWAIVVHGAPHRFTDPPA